MKKIEGNTQESKSLRIIEMRNFVRVPDLSYIVPLMENIVGNFRKQETIETKPLALACWLKICENARVKKEKGIAIKRSTAKIGRNEECPCGSGKKYKKCCLDKGCKKVNEIEGDKV